MAKPTSQQKPDCRQKSVSAYGPAQHLPPELLRHIFLFLLGIQGTRCNLALVCRRWCHIVNDTAHFWTQLRVSYGNNFSGCNSKVGGQSIWATLAARAASLPLDITITTSFARQDDGKGEEKKLGSSSQKKINTAFKQFIQTAPISRWQSLRLLGVGRLPTQLITGAFEKLKSFHARVDREDVYPIIRLVEETAFQLETLVLHGLGREDPEQPYLRSIVSRVSTLKCFDYPMWFGRQNPANITHLELEDFTYMAGTFTAPTVCIHRMAVGPLLRSVFTDVVNLRIGPILGAYHYTGVKEPFPSLRTIVLESSYVEILSFLDAPNLSSVQFLKPVINDGMSPSLSQQDWYRSFRMSRRHISIENKYAKNLLRVLPRVPQLEHVSAVLDLSAFELGDFHRASDSIRSLLICAFALEGDGNNINGNVESNDANNSSGPLFHFCPKLKTLHLQLLWLKTEKDEKDWYDCMVKILSDRLGNSPEYITVRWKNGKAMTVERSSARSV